MKSVTFLGVLFLSAFPCSAAMYGISPESGDFVQQSLFEKDSCRVGDTAPDGIAAKGGDTAPDGIASQRRKVSRRKKVGLVLSGGGAKGIAHIGVLKVLEEAGIPIDYIAGTSMGSIVGGMYAIGFSPAAMDSIMRIQNWLDVLSDKITRDKLFFTEKDVSDRTLITIPFDKDRFYISTGLLSGGTVMDMLSEYTVGYHNMETFDDLPIPFACIAYDLLTGDEVVMREGSLPLAIRASMSIPGAFTTVERGNRVLIDGGVINNFPADVVKEMGAEIIIGVDVSMMTQNREDLKKGTISESDRNSLLFIVDHMM